MMMICIRTCSVLRLLRRASAPANAPEPDFVPLCLGPFLVPEDTGLSLLAHAVRCVVIRFTVTTDRCSVGP
jgi:hypothetical protein